MSTTRVAIELPERDSYGEMMKSYLTVMRAFGMEMAARCQEVIAPKLGNWWFQQLVQQRIDEKKLRGQMQDLNDPILVLNEIGRELKSPIHAALPPDGMSIRSAKTIVAKRNELLHFSSGASLEDIAEVAHLVQLFARHYGMRTDGAIVPLLSRLSKLKRGQYVAGQPAVVSPPSSPADTEPATPPPDPPANFEIVEEPPRPKIGGVWSGSIPPREFKATRTGDLVSVRTGDSILGRVTGDASTRLRAWLAPNPKGDLWIAEDGAVGGYVSGVPRLLGYVGDEPPGEVARGFLLSAYLEVVGGEVRIGDTGATRALPESASVVDGELLRLTTYGDLIRISDDGVTRVATVDPSEWLDVGGRA